MSTDKTCAQVIDSHLKNREDSFVEILNKMDNIDDDDLNEEGWREFHEFGLELEKFTTLKYLMSTGGPADWLMITYKVNRYPEVVSVHYHFADWFDHASIEVSKESPLWRVAENLIEYDLA